MMHRISWRQCRITQLGGMRRNVISGTTHSPSTGQCEKVTSIRKHRLHVGYRNIRQDLRTDSTVFGKALYIGMGHAGMKRFVNEQHPLSYSRRCTSMCTGQTAGSLPPPKRNICRLSKPETDMPASANQHNNVRISPPADEEGIICRKPTCPAR